jgi:hypothetical protein
MEDLVVVPAHLGLLAVTAVLQFLDRETLEGLLAPFGEMTMVQVEVVQVQQDKALALPPLVAMVEMD